MVCSRALGALCVLVAVFVVDAETSVESVAFLQPDCDTWLGIAANHNCTLRNGCEKHKHVE